MAPVAQSDIDLESRASQDSPLHRQISEPLHKPSTSAKPVHSPTPVAYQEKCPWCGEYFEMSYEDSLSHEKALKEHIATVHPHIARTSTHDDTADEVVENEEMDGEHGDEYEDEHQENGEDAEEGDVADDGDDAIEADDGAAEDLKINEEVEHNADEADDPGTAPDVASDMAMEKASGGKQEFLSAENRLYNRWNIHDARDFSRNYDDATTELDQSWEYAFFDSKLLKKRDASNLPGRPDPYKKARVDRGKFLELTPIEDFLVDLRDPEMRSAEELYAITANAAHALTTWQDEYFAVDRLYKLSTGQYEKLAPDPRKKTEDPDIVADKKEAFLYQYKYDASKHKKNQEQDPWIQGGFRPTPTQVRKALKSAKIEPGTTPNIDRWVPLHKFGVEYVPKYQDPPPEDVPSKATRTRKAAEMEAAAAADEIARQAAAEEDEEPPAKRQTRSARVVHEDADELEPNSPKTSASTKGARGRGQGRGQVRGRGRGRGGASAPYNGPSENVDPAVAQTPATRGRGRGGAVGKGTGRGGIRVRGKGRVPSTPIATPRNASPAPPTPASSSRPTSLAPAPSHLAPLEPVSSTGLSTVPFQPSPADTIPLQPEDLDPAEQERRDRARAEKIANSKNPRRTEAMLNHWARFNQAGRIRNPKRSKDEIEASRVEAASRRANTSPKLGGRKRKSPPVPGSTTLLNPGIAPAPTPPGPVPTAAPGPLPASASIPNQAPTQAPPPPAPAPGSTLPLPTHTLPAPPGHPLGPGGPLAPHPQPRYTTPYPPSFGSFDPRAMPPFPSGPFQPPPPPARYQTPYPPDYFLPFSAPRPNLPPPGHAQRPA